MNVIDIDISTVLDKYSHCMFTDGLTATNITTTTTIRTTTTITTSTTTTTTTTRTTTTTITTTTTSTTSITTTTIIANDHNNRIDNDNGDDNDDGLMMKPTTPTVTMINYYYYIQNPFTMNFLFIENECYVHNNVAICIKFIATI